MSQEVAEFRKPRLPYHPEIEARYGVDKSGWKALVEAVYSSAKTVDAVVMALSYCRARNLDPFKRPVHIVPMWDTNKGTYVETVWPGISELRTTAFRTKQYAGCDEAEFGPDVTRTFTGVVGKRGHEETVTVEVTFPEWSRVTVHRELHGRLCKFVGPKAYWLETYAKRGKADVPNDMWEKRPRGQLEKCAEAAALRKAFPEEIGNQYAAEEMDGQRLVVDEREQPLSLVPPSPPQPAPKATNGNGADTQAQRLNAAAPRDPALRAGFLAQAPASSEIVDAETGEIREADDGEPVDPAAWLENLEDMMASAKDLSDLHDIRADYMDPNVGRVPRDDFEAAMKMLERHEARLKL